MTPVSVVTGGSSGIGLETARGLARLGHHVVLTGRDPERTARRVDEVRASTGNPRVDHVIVDFSSLADVRRAAAEILDRFEALRVLVNNAGLWHQKRQLSRDGFEDTLAVNHLAPFLLTSLLRERLERSAPARVVHVSSRLHAKPRRFVFDDLQCERRYKGIAAYARTKLANVLFSNELARRLSGTGVTSNSLHPGDVATTITRDSRLLSIGIKLVQPFILTPEQGALTSLHVATSPELEGVTGQYFDDCRPKAPSRAALDVDAARRLWELSERLTGLS